MGQLRVDKGQPRGSVPLSLINVMGRSKSENGSKLNARNLKATGRLSDARTKTKTFAGSPKGFVLFLGNFN